MGRYVAYVAPNAVSEEKTGWSIQMTYRPDTYGYFTHFVVFQSPRQAHTLLAKFEKDYLEKPGFSFSRLDMSGNWLWDLSNDLDFMKTPSRARKLWVPSTSSRFVRSVIRF